MNRFQGLAVIFLFSLRLAAAPPPRCKATGYFQVDPLLFSCDGAGGYPQDNQVQVSIRPRGTWAAPVPQATRNLIVTADAPTEISASLVDPFTLQALNPPSYKGVPYEVVANGGLPSHVELRLAGTSPNDLTLQVTNKAGIPAIVTIGYVYGYYTSPVVSRQCRPNHQPLGCAPFDQLQVRDMAADWSCWMGDKYGTSTAAWNGLAASFMDDGGGIPVYSWCSVWNSWKGRPRRKDACMKMYKFISQGGYELGVQSIVHPNWDWAGKSCIMRQFLVLCCQKLRSKWGAARDAWNEWRSSGLNNGRLMGASSTGPWETCGNLHPSGVTKDDFFKFLDADGVGGVQQSDIAVCWSKRPSKLLPSDVSYRPVPTSGLGSSNSQLLGLRSSNSQSSLPQLPPSGASAAAGLPSPSFRAAGPTAQPTSYPTFPKPPKPPKPLPQVKAKQQLSSILTGVAGGIAAAAAAATGITLAVQTGNKVTNTASTAGSSGRVSISQTPAKVSGRSSAPQAGTPSVQARRQTNATYVAPNNAKRSSSYSSGGGSSSGSFNVTSFTSMAPASLKNNPVIVTCIFIALICLLCSLIAWLVFCFSSPRKSRGSKDTISEREFENEEEYDEEHEEVPLLTTERMQMQEQSEFEDQQRMDHGSAQQQPPMAFGIETAQEYRQPGLAQQDYRQPGQPVSYHQPQRVHYPQGQQYYMQ